MNLSQIFSTPEREKILAGILYAEEVSVSEASRKLGLSKGLLSQYFSSLEKGGIFRRVGKKFAVNQKNPEVKALKILINVKRLSGISEFLKEIRGSVGLYGSWANGTNIEESDVDLWIRGKLSEEKIAELKGKMVRKMRRNVEILLLDEDRLGRIKREDPLFYHSLVFGSIILKGEGLA